MLLGGLNVLGLRAEVNYRFDAEFVDHSVFVDVGSFIGTTASPKSSRLKLGRSCSLVDRLAYIAEVENGRDGRGHRFRRQGRGSKR